MAVAFTHLASAGDTGNVSSYSSASVTPTAGSLLLVWWAVADADDPGTMNISTTLTGVTWTERFNQPWSTTATPTRRLKMWTGTGASGSGTITVSGMPDACQGASHFVVEATGYDTSNPIVQTVPTATDAAASQTTTFAAYGSADNAVICAFAKGGLPALVAEAGWTAVSTEKSFTTPDQRMWAQYQTSATDTSSTMTWASGTPAAASGGVEIRAASAATDRWLNRARRPVYAPQHAGVM